VEKAIHVKLIRSPLGKDQESKEKFLPTKTRGGPSVAEPTLRGGSKTVVTLKKQEKGGQCQKKRKEGGGRYHRKKKATPDETTGCESDPRVRRGQRTEKTWAGGDEGQDKGETDLESGRTREKRGEGRKGRELRGPATGVNSERGTKEKKRFKAPVKNQERKTQASVCNGGLDKSEGGEKTSESDDEKQKKKQFGAGDGEKRGNALLQGIPKVRGG